MLSTIISLLNAIQLIILTFLLTIFPSCGMLLAPYQSLTYEGQAVITDKIMEAIKSKDIDALEDMMSNKLKSRTKDLSGEIGALIDAIDGNILEYEWGGGGSNYDESNYGTRISRTSWDIEFKTGTKSYELIIGWGIINNRNPDEVGMGTFRLIDPDLLDIGSNDFILAEVPASET